MNLSLPEFYKSLNPSKILNYCNPTDRKHYIDLSSLRSSSVENLRDTIVFQPDISTCQFMTGYIGCGKTTELLRLKFDLEQEGFQVIYFESSNYLDMGDVDLSDIFLARE